MDQTEKRLIKKVKKGDQQAFALLVERYKNSVFAICLRMVGQVQEAEDLSQEAFIRAYKHIDQYDPDRNFQRGCFGSQRICQSTFCAAERTRFLLMRLYRGRRI
ncbi:RNA polymerase sigma factor SigW [Sporolactobacillus inulinus]|uniref:RNA polymerase sigma factor SigW n=1 Tax=Sporolactobacillus inulinus TaxID=2078 RepID=A0A4Y1ZH76_9BACL|nr:RNA polymerase sigma factor SigW [Sporolactobacillus inulinus]